MFVSVPTLVVLVGSAIAAYYVARKLLPKVLEKDHEAVLRLVDRMDRQYQSVLDKKAQLDATKSKMLSKLSDALKPKS